MAVSLAVSEKSSPSEPTFLTSGDDGCGACCGCCTVDIFANDVDVCLILVEEYGDQRLLSIENCVERKTGSNTPQPLSCHWLFY